MEVIQNCERLIVFTRYPEAGKTKTRMIPRLGADGAARLQRRMTEHTLAQVEASDRAISREIHFAGGTREQMQVWLGRDRIYREQIEGNLGQRMAAAFAGAFAEEMERVVLIGIDCPDLNAQLLDEAFEKLKSCDLVLGKTADGGYYLIGLRRSLCQLSLNQETNRQEVLSQENNKILNQNWQELFQEIAWGTADVLQQTVAIADRLGYAIAYLRLLHDVDYPEDLPIWEKYQAD